MNKDISAPWPSLPYDEFKSTAHLLHMCVQVLGKLKLHTPFEPHWANVSLSLTPHGITTGPIPYNMGIFSIDIDFLQHQLIVMTSLGEKKHFALSSMSVAELTKKILGLLQELGIDLKINMMPQEIQHPIAFDEDSKHCEYNKLLATNWWRILLSTYCVLQRYHAKFNGETPPIGLMWGTFDLRDARYNGIAVPTTGENSGYIRRNAMNEGHIEIGWWHGNDLYPKPAYYAYIYPIPDKIKQAKIEPNSAHWHDTLGEFILDYDDLRQSPEPNEALYSFFESVSDAAIQYAKWDPKLITSGKPV